MTYINGIPLSREPLEYPHVGVFDLASGERLGVHYLNREAETLLRLIDGPIDEASHDPRNLAHLEALGVALNRADGMVSLAAPVVHVGDMPGR